MGRNVLLLFADQMHAFAMGCAGNGQIRTPALDRLAAEGARFDAAYSNCPVCTPFRANLLTGRYGCQTGILGNGDPLPGDQPTLAETLNAAGCRTSYVGKWHLGGTGNGPIATRLRGGFTDFVGYQCYNDYLREVKFYDEAGREDDRTGRHRTDATTDVAIERLEKLAAGGKKPFAMFVSYQNPHYPVQPAEEYERLYRGVKIARRPNGRDVEPYTQTFSPPSPKPRADDPNFRRYGGNLDEYLRLYYAMVTQLDANVGRMVEALRRLKLADDTVVIFTSDHGDMQGSHGRTNKSLWWEESARIPLIVREPGGKARGVKVEAPVSGVDLCATVLDYAGAARPACCEGASLVPLVRGQATADRPAFSEMPGWAMVRMGAHKLVADRPGLTPRHLFNLKADPLEQRDLGDAPALACLRQTMQAELRKWQDDAMTRAAPRGRAVMAQIEKKK